MQDDQSGLPLFEWKPVCIVKAFPLSKRGGKVRDVARKLITKRTEVHIEQYVDQVSIALRRHLARFDIPVDEQERQLSDFWTSVNLEAARISHHATRDNNPKGAA